MSTDTLNDLRAAWLATISAADRAGAQLHGAGPPGRRLPWQDAVTECWRALSLVYAGLAADRESPGGSVGDLLTGLRAARVDADRAAALAARVRWRLGATEDRLRRTRDVADVVAARRLATAITRLDLVAARLAVGGRRIDSSVAALTGELAARPSPPRPTSNDNDAHHANQATHDNRATDANQANHADHADHADYDDYDDGRADDDGSAAVIACGCRAASALVTRRHRLTRPRPHRRALTMIRERRW
ncbi:hypothetical protein ACLQ3B_02780 [Micromonospora sp. DT53]|uniref:hypothetical protein n=1 Tax=Micromonospora sp. DT53 TaxID=3393444 RepID=UPI003CF9305B